MMLDIITLGLIHKIYIINVAFDIKKLKSSIMIEIY